MAVTVTKRSAQTHSVVTWEAINCTLVKQRGGTGDTKPLHTRYQRRSFHPQPICSTVRTADYPIACLECTEDVLTFKMGKTTHRRVSFPMVAKILQFGD